MRKSRPKLKRRKIGRIKKKMTMKKALGNPMNKSRLFRRKIKQKSKKRSRNPRSECTKSCVQPSLPTMSSSSRMASCISSPI